MTGASTKTSTKATVLAEALPWLKQLHGRIVVAWNQSAEAMVATRLALPFLKAADSVNITVISRTSPPSCSSSGWRASCSTTSGDR